MKRVRVRAHRRLGVSVRSHDRTLNRRDETHVQTLIFPRGRFSRLQAIDWARAHKKRYDKIDETGDSIRMRQASPSEFKRSSFRTIELGGSGVKAVVGHLRGNNEAASERKTIVIAWTEPEAEIEREGRVDLGERHKFLYVLRGRAAMWRNEGTEEDVHKAEQYAARENAQLIDGVPRGDTTQRMRVFVYPTTEKEPLERARRDVTGTGRRHTRLARGEETRRLNKQRYAHKRSKPWGPIELEVIGPKGPMNKADSGKVMSLSFATTQEAQGFARDLQHHGVQATAIPMAGSHPIVLASVKNVGDALTVERRFKAMRAPRLIS